MTYSRHEKKARKAIAKLGLEPLAGVSKCSIKRNRQIMFVINEPDVFVTPDKDTYIVFGEAKIEDLSAQAAAAAAEQFRAPAQAAEAAPAAAAAVADDDEEVDATGVDEKDIELVVSQAGVSRSAAVKALKNNDGDMVNAIMELTL